MEADKQEIAALVETHRCGFATLNADKLQSIWDRDYETIYCPMELSKPLCGWTEIAHYYQNVTKQLTHVRVMEIANLSIDILGDTAYVFYGFHFEGEFRDRGEPHMVEGRNTVIFRRIGGAWKGIHYHESRTGPH